MKKIFSSLIYLLLALCALVILISICFQVIQILDDRKHGAVVEGTILDQDGLPLPGVEVTFRNWNWRGYVPIPWSPARIVERRIKTKTDTNGAFSMKGTLPRADSIGASKPGFRQDDQETEYMWRPSGTGSAQPWTLHLFSEALIRPEQIRNLNFESVAFPQDGQLCFDLIEGKISSTGDADIVFRWQRLPATTNHGEYGKYVIRAPKGGVWFWEQERLFAPKENYEDGMVFFFHPSSLNVYMKKRRSEFFLMSRNGRVHARVFTQLNTGNSTLSVRARVNSSSNRFVDAKSESYAIGVYASMSPGYFNPGVPWWIPTDPTKGQVILSPEHASSMLTGEVTKIRFPAYFAGHYQTPPSILASMVSSSPLMLDHYVPQALAKNLGAPVSVLQQMKTNAASWKARGVEGTITFPEDAKRFLTAPE